MANIEYSRLLLKRSVTSGVVPTVPITNNLNDFSATDIFEGELFYNVADGILFSRDLAGITVLGAPAAPADLNSALALGAETGGLNIVLSSNDRITNPTALYPLESSISLGAGSPGDNKVDIRSEDLTTGDYSILQLYPGVLATQNIFKAEVFNNSNGVTVSHQLSTDETGFAGLFIQDTVNNMETLVTQTPMFAQTFTTRDDITSNRQSTHLQGPASDDFAINDLTSGNSLTDEANIITNLAWSRTTTGATYNTAIEQYFDGNLNIEAGAAVTIDTPIIKTPQLPAYADDADAGVGGLVTGDLYQTDGTGGAPLNVAGILMIKQ